MDCIEVDMYGDWKSASHPACLATRGVATCIAVAVTNNKTQTAWLIHSPAFGHQCATLSEMLDEAKAGASWEGDLTVWVRGADLDDPDIVGECGVAAEIDLAKTAVQRLIAKSLPQAQVTYEWGAVDLLTVTFSLGSWACVESPADLR